MIEQQSNRCEKINASDESDCINWSVGRVITRVIDELWEIWETWKENREEGLVMACDSMIRLLFNSINGA